MRRYRHISPLIKLVVDLLLLAASFLITAFVSRKRISPGQGFWHFAPHEGAILVLLLAIWFFSSRFIDLYDEFRSQSRSFELISVFRASLTQAGAAVLLLFINKDPRLNRYFVVFYLFTQLVLLAAGKIFFRQILLWIRRNGKNVRSVLILGSTPIGLTFAREVQASPHMGYRVLGFLDNRPKLFPGVDYLGRLSRLESILRTQTVDEVVLALPTCAQSLVDQIVGTCEKYTMRVRIISDYCLSLGKRSKLSLLGRIPVLSLNLNPLGEFPNDWLKRGFDLVFTTALFLTVFLWLWPLIALAIKLDSRGPVFYKQKRWGKNNKKFICYKFRSMACKCRQFDKNGRFLQARQADTRVTRVGRFLRRMNLDELPQFWNVLRGSMSVVGPRPHPIPLGRKYKDRVHHYFLRLLVKPGITGWAQVNGFRGETKTISQMRKRVEHDLWYITNWSFWLDLQIILLSIRTIFFTDPHAY